jgi:hypothetical protein
MCVTCGCHSVEDEHGDPRNITLSELKAAADAAGLTLEEVVANIEEDGVEAGSGSSRTGT